MSSARRHLLLLVTIAVVTAGLIASRIGRPTTSVRAISGYVSMPASGGPVSACTIRVLHADESGSLRELCSSPASNGRFYFRFSSPLPRVLLEVAGPQVLPWSRFLDSADLSATPLSIRLTPESESIELQCVVIGKFAADVAFLRAEFGSGAMFIEPSRGGRCVFAKVPRESVTIEALTQFGELRCETFVPVSTSSAPERLVQVHVDE